MNAWLCPVRLGSWRIIKAKKLFGVPRRQLEVLRHVQCGDLLVFHVLRPINGIVSVCRVASDAFEDHGDVWGKDRYPFRVRLEFIPSLTRDEQKPVPLSLLFGAIDNKNGIKIEPYLKNVWITKISKQQYENLRKLFADQT